MKAKRDSSREFGAQNDDVKNKTAKRKSGGGREFAGGDRVFEVVRVEAIEAAVAGFRLRIHEEGKRLAG